MPRRDKAHTFSGKTVKVKAGDYTGQDFWLDDWLDRIVARPEYTILPSFIDTERMRIRDEGFSPKENDLVYGRIGVRTMIFNQDQLDLELSRAKVSDGNQ